jgi:hypothetical protein
MGTTVSTITPTIRLLRVLSEIEQAHGQEEIGMEHNHYPALFLHAQAPLNTNLISI